MRKVFSTLVHHFCIRLLVAAATLSWVSGFSQSSLILFSSYHNTAPKAVCLSSHRGLSPFWYLCFYFRIGIFPSDCTRITPTVNLHFVTFPYIFINRKLISSSVLLSSMGLHGSCGFFLSLKNMVDYLIFCFPAGF